VARIAALTCLVALLAGCGGDDKKDAEQTVRDFVTAVNERDADAYCDELITEEFREKSTFATGDKASESCKREFKAIKGLHIELVRVVRTKVDGDKATTTVVFRRSGQEIRQQVLLEKDGGDWKIAGGTG
jgi:ketosteroid isomerase-like protein